MQSGSAIRRRRAEVLLAGGGVVSVHVLNELVLVARRKLGFSWKEVRRCTGPRCDPDTLPITDRDQDARSGATHCCALRMPHYDALVAAAALESGCTTLYSEDLQEGQVIDSRLAICNPFTA
jgi:predicted nucleic acid-binding protein